MNGKRTAGAVAGALVAGLGLTAMMMAQEKKTRKASELTDLGRASAHQLGVHHVPAGERPPDAQEQAVVQGGHLLLSALAGVAYAAATDEDTGVVPSGVAFGLAFYGLAHWLTGPLLGVKQPEWRSGGKTIGMHTAIHIAFGLATAAGAKLASRTSA
ncbi:hypothetical protein H5J25_19810 (plasmid) [Sphingomonas aliaeris]|uniref:DUF1440 domain-containing protein n=1 Tax=Sphingomonas aliaeris TaxID=2759526 RepID=A0A974NZ30_9SPHN|nr:hypothetical protein [Sphingomonas aliaeris]QQV79446.1 hypothetical protein H5J25_19810 [Sphingomonas aliaeris]